MKEGKLWFFTGQQVENIFTSGESSKEQHQKGEQETRVKPDIWQCRIIRPDIRQEKDGYPARKRRISGKSCRIIQPDIRHPVWKYRSSLTLVFLIYFFLAKKLDICRAGAVIFSISYSCALCTIYFSCFNSETCLTKSGGLHLSKLCPPV